MTIFALCQYLRLLDYVECGLCVFSSRRRHTRCALVTGVQTCALPISGEAAAEQHRLDEAELVQIGQDAEGLQRRRTRVDESMATRMEAWRALLVEADIDLDIASAPATLDVLDELRAAIAAQRDLQTRIDGIAKIGRASCRERVGQYV